MSANEVWIGSDPGDIVVINDTEANTEFIADALKHSHPEIATMLNWGNNVRGRKGGLLERDRYTTPPHIYAQMKVSRDACESDDVVSGVLETTESLAFNRMSVQCEEEDEEDIWNQIIEDIDLDDRIREMWREMFTVSQFYVASWWTTKSYKVGGKSKKGVQRKKQFLNLKVPEGITLLDPHRIVPVGNFMFGQEELCWAAGREEVELYDNILSGQQADETIKRLLTGKRELTREEHATLGQMGFEGGSLYTLNPKVVYRVTATRPQFKPFADVRMKSVFPLLDLKEQLREMDRAYLLGATNFIVLIRKGSDAMPARQDELTSLQSAVRTLSRIPVIVGDHRLEIEIITPKIDMVLTPEKYNTIDARITARLYKMFMTGNYAAGAKGDDSMKLVRIVARGMEATRSLIRRSIEEQILDQVYERNDALTQPPALQFHPKSIAIDFDPGLAAFFMDLLDRRHVSRQTVLEQIDLDQDDEARKKEREAENYDEIFESLTPLQDPDQVQGHALEQLDEQQKDSLETLDKNQKFQEKQAEKQRQFMKENPPAPPPGAAKPGAAVKKKPANADPKSAGRSGGGNRSGGGAAPGTGQGQEKDARRRAKG